MDLHVNFGKISILSSTHLKLINKVQINLMVIFYHDIWFQAITAWYVPVYRFFLVRLFLHPDSKQRDIPYVSVFSPNAGPEKTWKTLNANAFHAVNGFDSITFSSSIHSFRLPRRLDNITITHLSDLYLALSLEEPAIFLKISQISQERTWARVAFL